MISVAQARAMTGSIAVEPGILAHPPFSMNPTCSQELAFFNSSSFAGASAARRKFSRQMGARAPATAVAAFSFACNSAEERLTQPPHEKPTIARAAAPATAPQMAGFSATGICMISIRSSVELWNTRAAFFARRCRIILYKKTTAVLKAARTHKI